MSKANPAVTVDDSGTAYSIYVALHHNDPRHGVLEQLFTRLVGELEALGFKDGGWTLQ